MVVWLWFHDLLFQHDGGKRWVKGGCCSMLLRLFHNGRLGATMTCGSTTEQGWRDCACGWKVGAWCGDEGFEVKGWWIHVVWDKETYLMREGYRTYAWGIWWNCLFFVVEMNKKGDFNGVMSWSFKGELEMSFFGDGEGGWKGGTPLMMKVVCEG